MSQPVQIPPDVTVTERLMATPTRPATVLQPTYGPYTFATAHSELHESGLQPLRGHTYSVTVRLRVRVGDWRHNDGAIVQMVANKVVAPLRDRTLVAEYPAAGRCLADERQITIEAGLQRYSFPRAHVTLLPIENTTLDVLAGYLLEQLTPELAEVPGLSSLELTLAESPFVAVTVSAGVGPNDGSLSETDRRNDDEI